MLETVNRMIEDKARERDELYLKLQDKESFLRDLNKLREALIQGNTTENILIRIAFAVATHVIREGQKSDHNG